MNIEANYSKLTNEAALFTMRELVKHGTIKKESASSEADIAELLKKHDSDIKQLWAKNNPKLAYPISISEITEHPNALSISDDDKCSSCDLLSYNPGELSLCLMAITSDQTPFSWPCKFNEDGYSQFCGSHKTIPDGETNVIPDIEEVE